MNFDFTHRSIPEWRTFLEKVPRPNSLQTFSFAAASKIHDQKNTKVALIERDGAAIGMFALQEIKVGPIQVVDLYRGPMWFTVSPPDIWLCEFAELFAKMYPKSLLRRRRWLPEWPNQEQARDVLIRLGFKPKPLAFETILIDLTQDESSLRSQLKQKWRNALNKAERSALEIKADWSGASANIFLKQYALDKATKKYRGRSPRFVGTEVALALKFQEALILWAFEGEVAVAGILILVHGSSATYRIGWTTEAGRKNNSHNVLLWEAIKQLKSRRIRYFDLGGIEPVKAEGLTHFKEGLGGESLKLLGIFG